MYIHLFRIANHLSRNLPGNLAFVLLGLSAVSAFALQRRLATGQAWVTALTVLAFGVADLLMLAGLPFLGLSFGPTRVSLIWITVLRAGVWMAMLAAAGIMELRASGGAALSPGAGVHAPLLWTANLSISALALYGMYVEPFDLRVTTLRFASPKIQAARPIRIVQLSDIHVERTTRREREMLEKVRALQPDLIVLTGDYLNIDYVNDPQARRDGRAALEQLSAPYGVYAVTGSRGVDQPEAVQALFTGLPIRLLRDEVAEVQIAGATIDLVGIGLEARESDRAKIGHLLRQKPDERYTLLLYHTPDLADTAAANGVDLYLAGHTHGGQIRLPWWGALVTMSAYGKRFEAGLYTLGETRLYVSRGIGMEGLRLPRARFLAPPEIVLIELMPEQDPEQSRAAEQPTGWLGMP